jgi:hypothetical protein
VPCSECRVLTSGWFTGVYSLNANVSRETLFHHHGKYVWSVTGDVNVEYLYGKGLAQRILQAKPFPYKYPTFSTPVTLHTYSPMKMGQCVLEHRHLNYRRWWITWKKAYDILKSSLFMHLAPPPAPLSQKKILGKTKMSHSHNHLSLGFAQDNGHIFKKKKLSLSHIPLSQP